MLRVSIFHLVLKAFSSGQHFCVCQHTSKQTSKVDFPLTTVTIKLFQLVKRSKAVTTVTISKQKEKHSKARISLTVYSK